MSALELIHKQICTRFTAPHPVTPGGGAGGADAAVPGRTGLFIASGEEPGQPRDRTSSLWPELFPSSPRPNAISIPGVCLPQTPHQTRRSPRVVWGWGRRAGQGALLVNVLLRPAPTQGEEDGGEKGRPTGGKGLKLLFLNSGDPRF